MIVQNDNKNSFLFLSPATYNSDDVALGYTDDIQKRNVCRTTVKAAAALYTILDSIILKFFHHIVACIFLQQEWFQTHRTGLRTFSATDTCALDSAHCLFCRQIKQRRRALLWAVDTFCSFRYRYRSPILSSPHRYPFVPVLWLIICQTIFR